MNRLHPDENTLNAQISSLVVDCIETGERLPTEEEMMEKFNVSRTQLRKELNIFEANGIIVSQQGSGRHVQAPDIGAQIVGTWSLLIQAKPALLLDLMEIRSMLEISTIPMVLEKITIDQLHSLAYQISEMKRKAEQKKTFAKNDREFHRVLYLCMDNVLLSQLMGAFWDLYDKSKIESYHEGLVELAAQHEEMLDAIIHKDAERLKTLMREQHEDARYQIIMSLVNSDGDSRDEHKHLTSGV